MTNKSRNIVLDNTEAESKFNSSDYDFNVMPDEFFNSQYQQSRVRKEQQLEKEKMLIDKKKREKEERLKRLAEAEKIEREREAQRQERKKQLEEEKAQKREEKEFIENKKREIAEQKRQEILAEKEKREALKNKKIEEKNKLKEINKKAKEEQKNFRKNQKELLKQELLEKERFLREQKESQNDDSVKINKEVERALIEERKKILKKLKLEQKLNKQEQKRILKEKKEEEKERQRKIKEESQRRFMEELKNAANTNKKGIDLGFVEDDRLDKAKEKKKKRKTTVTIVISAVSVVAVVAVLWMKGVINFTDCENEIPEEEDYSIRLTDNAFFSFDYNDYQYEVKFNDRRDLGDIDLNVVKGDDLHLKNLHGVFTFGKTGDLNKPVNVKIKNVDCSGDYSLNYYNSTYETWESIQNISCNDGVLDFGIVGLLRDKYAVLDSKYVPQIELVYKHDDDLNYDYVYDFSRFADYFGYKINGNIGDYSSAIEREIFGLDECNSLDCDSDGYLNGEEIINLYNPLVKTYEYSISESVDNNKITYKDFNSLKVYYPTYFLANISENKLYIKSDNNNEYFVVEDIGNIQDKSEYSQMLSLKLFFDAGYKYDMYVNDIGNTVYLVNNLNNNGVKVSYYFEDKNNVNFVSIFLMLIKGLNL